MKILIAFLMFINLNQVLAQQLTAGNYTSPDGRYTVIVEQVNGQLKITEANKVNIYKPKGNAATYYHTEPKYASYYIRVVAVNKYYTGKTGGTEYLFTYSGGNTSTAEVLPSGADNCPLYDKYANMIKKDPNNTQGWAFCAAAALAYCTYNVDERKEMLTPIVQALKAMLEKPDKCPCEDVIPATIWNSIKVD